MQAFPDRWRQVLRLFKRVTTRPFGYLMLDVHQASDDRYRLWSHLTPREGKAQVHTLPVDVPAFRKRAATRTRPSTSAKRRRTTHCVISPHGYTHSITGRRGFSHSPTPFGYSPIGASHHPLVEAAPAAVEDALEAGYKNPGSTL